MPGASSGLMPTFWVWTGWGFCVPSASLLGRSRRKGTGNSPHPPARDGLQGGERGWSSVFFSWPWGRGYSWPSFGPLAGVQGSRARRSSRNREGPRNPLRRRSPRPPPHRPKPLPPIPPPSPPSAGRETASFSPFPRGSSPWWGSSPLPAGSGWRLTAEESLRVLFRREAGGSGRPAAASRCGWATLRGLLSGWGKGPSLFPLRSGRWTLS